MAAGNYVYVIFGAFSARIVTAYYMSISLVLRSGGSIF